MTQSLISDEYFTLRDYNLLDHKAVIKTSKSLKYRLFCLQALLKLQKSSCSSLDFFSLSVVAQPHMCNISYYCTESCCCTSHKDSQVYGSQYIGFPSFLFLWWAPRCNQNRQNRLKYYCLTENQNITCCSTETRSVGDPIGFFLKVSLYFVPQFFFSMPVVIQIVNI